MNQWGTVEVQASDVQPESEAVSHSWGLKRLNNALSSVSLKLLNTQCAGEIALYTNDGLF